MKRRRTLSRRHRGATIIWFLFFGLPLVMFNAVLMVDISKLVVAGRQAANIADAAALAGAQQFACAEPAGAEPASCLVYSVRVDPARAVDKMQYMVNEAKLSGAVGAKRQVQFVNDTPISVRPCVGTPDEASPPVCELTSRKTGGVADRVTAVVRYDSGRLVFLPFIEALFGDQSSLGELVEVSSADVCIPGEYDATDGFCTRPDTRGP